MNRKADFYKTNRFESIRITNRIESIRIANWNALPSAVDRTAVGVTRAERGDGPTPVARARPASSYYTRHVADKCAPRMRRGWAALPHPVGVRSGRWTAS